METENRLSQKCPFCPKVFDRLEDLEAHITEHRFEQQQNVDSIREFGVKKNFAPYVCGVCHLEFDFDLSASDKIKAHTVWHIEDSKKKNSSDVKQELRLTERQIYLNDPEVQERIQSFDTEHFGQSERAVEPESVEVSKPSSKSGYTPKQKHTVWVNESPRLRFPKLSSSQRVFLFVVIVIVAFILIVNIVSAIVK
jgi:hypothetical protein